MNSATKLRSILKNKDTEAQDRFALEAEVTKILADKHAARKRTVYIESNRKLEIDSFIRENYGVDTRWKIFRAVNDFEEGMRHQYKLTPSELELFRDDLEDLIEAGFAGVDIAHKDYTDDAQDTARVILRVLYQDDWKKFVTEYAEKVGFTPKQ